MNAINKKIHLHCLEHSEHHSLYEFEFSEHSCIEKSEHFYESSLLNCIKSIFVSRVLA